MFCTISKLLNKPAGLLTNTTPTKNNNIAVKINIKIFEKWDVWISTLIFTPSIQGMHHHATQKDTEHNYSTILSCWDVIFSLETENNERPIRLFELKIKMMQAYLGVLSGFL